MNFETQMIIASNLRTLRISKQLTQAKVASFAGISRSLYAHYELGSRTQDAETLHTIAKAFEIDMDILFERDRDKFLSILASTPSTGSDTAMLVSIYKQLSPYSKGALMEKAFTLLEGDKERESRRRTFIGMDLK